MTGNDGASVTVPAGVLKQDSTVTIAIAKDASGVPVAPPGESFLPVSNTFTITPHGQSFAEPVQVTLPFDASLVRDTDQLVILKAQPLGNWVAHSDVTRQGSMATLAVRDFSVFLVAIRTGIRLVPAPTTPAPAPVPVPFSFSLAVSGTSPNLTITYTFSGTRPTCIEGDRLETVFMTVSDDSYHNSLGFPVHYVARTEQLAVMVPGFSPPAPALSGPTLTHAVIQPAHSKGGSYDTGSLEISPYVKGRYTCTSERLPGNAVAAPWTLEAANEAFLPYNGSGMVLLGDITNLQTSVGATVVSRARAQTVGWFGLQSRSRWEISRDNGASWTLLKLGAERVTPDTSIYGEAAARAAGLWAIEGDLPAFAGTDNGALLRFSACTAIEPLFRSGDPMSLPCATGAPHTVSVAFVAQAPAFTAMPASMAVVAGAGASFSVATSGLPTPTLQWQRRVPQGAWEDVPGAQGSTYNLSATTLTQDGTQYQVVATNSSGSATSALATLNVVDQAAPPTIGSVSGPLMVVEGGSAVFAATVSGTAPLSFQWRRNGVDILGANTAILRLDGVANAQAGSYVLQVGNPAGNVQSTAQQLTVAPAGTVLPTAPSIVTQPVSVLVNAGNTATFAVGASGSGPLAYQWRRNNLDIAGATDAFYSIASAASGDAATYAVVVSNDAGSASSFNVNLTVNATASPQAATIITQPGSIVVAPGMSVALGVGAQGSGPIAYQWLRNGTVLPGQTQATLTIGAATSLDAGAYQVQVSNAVGGPVTSTAAQVILLGAPAIGSQPANASVGEGSTTTFNVSASGSALLYQWMRNSVAIAGATSASYTTPALTLADSGAVYGVIVYNGAGLVFSQGAVLSVTPVPVSIGGTVSGLTAAGLVLQDNGGDNLSVAANAVSFSFATPIANGSAYSVSVLTQPSGQTCTLQNASGTASATVSNIALTCVNVSTGPGPLVATTMATGYGNSLVVASDGTAWAWGYLVDPATGGYKPSSPWATTPVQVQGLAGVKAVSVSAEASSSYALHTDGSVSAWGRNTDGQLGDRTVTERLAPVKVMMDATTPMNQVCAITASAHILAMLRQPDCNGTAAVAWIVGWFSGTLTGGDTSSSSPTNGAIARAVPGMPAGVGVKSLTAPHSANAAGGVLFRLEDGRWLAWGSNSSNQLGAGSANFAGGVNGPANVSGFWAGACCVEFGRTFSLALQTATASLVPAGGDLNGELGNGAGGGSSTVLMPGPVTAFSAGQVSAAAITAGQLWAWGWNGNSAVESPTRVGTGSGFTSVSVGDIHSLAIGPNGEVYSWGDSSYGALGRSGTGSLPAVVMRP